MSFVLSTNLYKLTSFRTAIIPCYCFIILLWFFSIRSINHKQDHWKIDNHKKHRDLSWETLVGEKTQQNFFFYRFAATKNRSQTRLYARPNDQITLAVYPEKAHIATWMNDSIDHTLTLIYSDSDRRRDTTLVDLTTLQYIILFFFELIYTIIISFEVTQSSTLPLSKKGILLSRYSYACLYLDGHLVASSFNLSRIFVILLRASQC